MTDTIAEPKAETAAPDAAAIAAAEVDRLTAGGPNAEGRTVTLDHPEAFRRSGTAHAQTLLDAVRGYGLRPKPETADAVHAALGAIAIAAVPIRQAEFIGYWWKQQYPEDSLLGHLIRRLNQSTDAMVSTASFKATITGAATALDEAAAFDPAPVTVSGADHELLLDIGSGTSLTDLVKTDQRRPTASDETEIRLAAERLAADGVVYMKQASYRLPDPWIAPTPAGMVVLKQLQADRAARIAKLEADRDAAIDALLPDVEAAHTAAHAAFVDLNNAWQALTTCATADLSAAVEHLDQAQAAATDTARTWQQLRNSLESHVNARSYRWPAGGRPRLVAALAERGIDLDTNLNGPANRVPDLVPALIGYQEGHLTATIANRVEPQPEPEPDAVEPVTPAPTTADTDSAEPRLAAATQLARAWRLAALVAAALALAGLTATVLLALILA